MKVKKLECQTCGKTHRLYRAAAKCRYKYAYLDGEGPYATLHYNRDGYGLQVYLHETKVDAQEFINRASAGREGEVLYRSTHNGIWRFTREGRWMKRW